MSIYFGDSIRIPALQNIVICTSYKVVRCNSELVPLLTRESSRPKPPTIPHDLQPTTYTLITVLSHLRQTQLFILRRFTHNCRIWGHLWDSGRCAILTAKICKQPRDMNLQLAKEPAVITAHPTARLKALGRAAAIGMGYRQMVQFRPLLLGNGFTKIFVANPSRYTNLEARVQYLHTFLDFGSSGCCKCSCDLCNRY